MGRGLSRRRSASARRAVGRPDDQAIDQHLERMAEFGQADRRNGYYARWLLTELGMIELRVPRTRPGARSGWRRPQGKTGAGALRGRSWWRSGCAPTARRKSSTSASPAPRAPPQWEPFLGDLVRRDLTGERLEMLGVDGLPGRSGVGAPLPNLTGQSGLLAALPTAYPEVPVRRCWAGAQDLQRAEHGGQGRPGRHEGRLAPDHERQDAADRLGRRPALRRSLADRLSQSRRPIYRSIWTTRSPASATRPSSNARSSEPPMPSSAASTRFVGARGRWAPSRTALPWTAYCSPCSCTKTATRASPPPSP